jgi:hypothetical protein
MKKLFCFTLLLIGFGIVNTSCFKWDNPYDLDNEIVLSLEPIPNSISNDSTFVIKWDVATKNGKSIRNFDIKISLFHVHNFLEEIIICEKCNSNDRFFQWHVKIEQPDGYYWIEIKSVANYFIQAHSNEFSIIGKN